MLVKQTHDPLGHFTGPACAAQPYHHIRADQGHLTVHYHPIPDVVVLHRYPNAVIDGEVKHEDIEDTVAISTIR